MLRLLSILFIVPYVFGDCAYHWGDYAFKEVRCRVIRVFFQTLPLMMHVIVPNSVESMPS